MLLVVGLYVGYIETVFQAALYHKKVVFYFSLLLYLMISINICIFACLNDIYTCVCMCVNNEYAHKLTRCMTDGSLSFPLIHNFYELYLLPIHVNSFHILCNLSLSLSLSLSLPSSLFLLKTSQRK